MTSHGSRYYLWSIISKIVYCQYFVWRDHSHEYHLTENGNNDEIDSFRTFLIKNEIVSLKYWKKKINLKIKFSLINKEYFNFLFNNLFYILLTPRVVLRKSLSFGLVQFISNLDC